MAVASLKLGDVFTIPLGDGRFGLGQAVDVGPHDSVYMVVFDAVLADESEIVDLAELVATAKFLLATWASSVQVEIGRWKVLDRVPAREDFPRPAFKVAIGGPGNIHVEDWGMTRRRPATPEEAARLPLRSSFSAMSVENALKGLLGLGPKLEGDEDILASLPEMADRPEQAMRIPETLFACSDAWKAGRDAIRSIRRS